MKLRFFVLAAVAAMTLSCGQNAEEAFVKDIEAYRQQMGMWDLP